jgi:hypothetical protein
MLVSVSPDIFKCPFNAELFLIRPFRFSDSVCEQSNDIPRLQIKPVTAGEFVVRHESQRDIRTVECLFHLSVCAQNIARCMSGTGVDERSRGRIEAAEDQGGKAVRLQVGNKRIVGQGKNFSNI